MAHAQAVEPAVNCRVLQCRTPEGCRDGGAEVAGINWGGLREAPLCCVVPLCLTALGCLVLFFYADDIYRLLAPIAAPVGASG